MFYFEDVYSTNSVLLFWLVSIQMLVNILFSALLHSGVQIWLLSFAHVLELYACFTLKSFFCYNSTHPLNQMICCIFHVRCATSFTQN